MAMSQGTQNSIRAGSTALSLYGQKLQADATVKAYHDEAVYYENEAFFAEQVAQREEEVYAKQAKQVIANQELSLSANGLDLSKSSLSLIQGSLLDMNKEIKAIRTQGAFNIGAARMKQSQSIAGIKGARTQQLWSGIETVAESGAKAAMAGG